MLHNESPQYSTISSSSQGDKDQTHRVVSVAGKQIRDGVDDDNNDNTSFNNPNNNNEDASARHSTSKHSGCCSDLENLHVSDDCDDDAVAEGGNQEGMPETDLLALKQALREVRNPLATTTSSTLDDCNNGAVFSAFATAELERLTDCRNGANADGSELDWRERRQHRRRRSLSGGDADENADNLRSVDICTKKEIDVVMLPEPTAQLRIRTAIDDLAENNNNIKNNFNDNTNNSNSHAAQSPGSHVAARQPSPSSPQNVCVDIAASDNATSAMRRDDDLTASLPGRKRPSPDSVCTTPPLKKERVSLGTEKPTAATEGGIRSEDGGVIPTTAPPRKGFLRLGGGKQENAPARPPMTLSLRGTKRTDGAHNTSNEADQSKKSNNNNKVDTAEAVVGDAVHAVAANSSSISVFSPCGPAQQEGHGRSFVRPPPLPRGTSYNELLTGSSQFSPTTPGGTATRGAGTDNKHVISFDVAGMHRGPLSPGINVRLPSVTVTPTPTPFANGGETPHRRHRVTRIPLPAAPVPVDFSLVQRTVEQFYELTTKLSEGTYGEVYVGKNKETGEVVALKRLKTLRGLDGFPITSLREVIALQHITRQRDRMRAAQAHAESVTKTAGDEEASDPLSQMISLKDVLLSGEGSHDIFLVFNYASSSLAGLLTSKFPFSLIDIAYIFRRLLCGVQKLHAMGILHRDIKSDNVLLTKDGGVQLADFGLCMFEDSGRRALTPSMINLSYRPPEMLLGSTVYDTKVDVWSIGCFLAQVFLMHPPFHRRRTAEEQAQAARHNRSAETELEQLALIAEVLGPLSSVPPGAFPPETCAHMGHLQQLQERVSAASRGGGGSGGLYRSSDNAYALSPTAPRPDRSGLGKVQALFERSVLFAQFHGFRRWFLAAMDNRRAQHALSAGQARDGVQRPPLLIPSPACLDVLTAIFQYDPRRRPTASELLAMPFFQLLEDNTRGAFLHQSTARGCPTTSAWEAQQMRNREKVAQEALAAKLSQFPDSHINPKT